MMWGLLRLHFVLRLLCSCVECTIVQGLLNGWSLLQPLLLLLLRHGLHDGQLCVSLHLREHNRRQGPVDIDGSRWGRYSVAWRGSRCVL